MPDTTTLDLAALQPFLDALPFYCLLVDDDHRILGSNTALQRDLDVDPQELLGAFCPRAIHGIDHAFEGCPLEEAVACGVSVEREHHDPHTGRWLLSAVYRSPYRSEEGKAVWVHTVRDISAHKAEEQARLRQVEASHVFDAILRLVTEDLDQVALLRRALELIFSLPWMPLEPRGAVFLVEPETGDLVMRSHLGMDPRVVNVCARVSPGWCICGRAAASRTLQYKSFVDDDHDVKLPGAAPHGHYCAPLLAGDRLVGVLNLYLADGHEGSEEERRFLDLVCKALVGALEHRRARAELEGSRASFQAVVDRLDDGICVSDSEGMVLFANPAARAMLEPVLGAPEQWRMASASPGTTWETPILRLGGTEGVGEVWVSRTRWDGLDASLHAIRDITERKALERRLQERSLRDPLTELYNRRGLYEVGGQLLSIVKRERSQVLVVFVDVDDMKAINDVHGHARGDEALRAVAKELQRGCRAADVLARVGGDEFVVLAAVGSRAQAAQAEARLRGVLGSTSCCSGLPFTVTASLGAHHLRRIDELTMDELLHMADEAMYREKASRSEKAPSPL